MAKREEVGKLSPDEIALLEQTSAGDWLARQTPAIEGWKAEDAAFKSYCQRREEGHKAEALARFFTPYWAGDFEARYQDERRLGPEERL